jgi:2-iminobutanoate/2-iminopropanoate deaminase
VAERLLLSPETVRQSFGHSELLDLQPGRVLLLSGQAPLDSGGRLVGDGDFAAQVRQVFRNLTVELEAADASWADVVQLRFAVTDTAQVEALREIRDEYVDDGQPSTLVEVRPLRAPDVLVEADAAAILD